MPAYMMLDVITNENITPVSKAMRSKLEESLVAGPRTHVEPANGFPSTMKAEHYWGHCLVNLYIKHRFKSV